MKIRAKVKKRGFPHDDVAIYIDCEPRAGNAEEMDVALSESAGGGFHSDEFGSSATFIVNGVATTATYWPN